MKNKIFLIYWHYYHLIFDPVNNINEAITKLLNISNDGYGFPIGVYDQKNNIAYIYETIICDKNEMIISIKKTMKLNDDHNFNNIVMFDDDYFKNSKEGKNNDI